VELSILVMIAGAFLFFGLALVIWGSTWMTLAKKKESDIYEALEEQIGALRHSLYSLSGKVDGLIIAAKVAEKMADRAFTMASSANVANGIIQRALHSRPPGLGKSQQLKDQVARKKLEDLFGRDEMEFLKPLLSEEELELLEEAQEKMRKAELNGKVTQ
jgi:hypothetical protein